LNECSLDGPLKRLGGFVDLKCTKETRVPEVAERGCA
jgi:hypothetical protein